VAKEFVACRDDEAGVLVLSSQAGAASELYAAVLTNSGDGEDLVRAYRSALAMPLAEQQSRMRHMRLRVQSHDVFSWSDRCLEFLNDPECYSIPKRAGGRELCEFSLSPMYTAI
jgi:trehalose 6-phosphate synthase